MPAIQHIVLLKLNDGCGSNDIRVFNEQFKNIVNEIDTMVCGTITSVEYAKKFNTFNKGEYTHVVFCLFSDIKGLEIYYENSKEHEKLKEMIGKYIDGDLKDNIIEFDSWNPTLSSKL